MMNLKRLLVTQQWFLGEQSLTTYQSRFCYFPLLQYKIILPEFLLTVHYMQHMIMHTRWKEE